MIKKYKFRLVYWVALVALLIFVGHAVSFSQEQSDEELKKKYEAVIGDYEFDLTELGGETQTLTFYVEDGKFWADSGDGMPGVMEPVEEEMFKFTVEDPQSGVFEITFKKDEEGKYTKCHILIESMGLEITGIKIGG